MVICRKRYVLPSLARAKGPSRCAFRQSSKRKRCYDMQMGWSFSNQRRGQLLRRHCGALATAQVEPQAAMIMMMMTVQVMAIRTLAAIVEAVATNRRGVQSVWGLWKSDENGAGEERGGEGEEAFCFLVFIFCIMYFLERLQLIVVSLMYLPATSFPNSRLP